MDNLDGFQKLVSTRWTFSISISIGLDRRDPQPYKYLDWDMWKIKLFLDREKNWEIHKNHKQSQKSRQVLISLDLGQEVLGFAYGHRD